MYFRYEKKIFFLCRLKNKLRVGGTKNLFILGSTVSTVVNSHYCLNSVAKSSNIRSKEINFAEVFKFFGRSISATVTELVSVENVGKELAIFGRM
jgi:hypothetical protein